MAEMVSWEVPEPVKREMVVGLNAIDEPCTAGVILAARLTLPANPSRLASSTFIVARDP